MNAAPARAQENRELASDLFYAGVGNALGGVMLLFLFIAHPALWCAAILLFASACSAGAFLLARHYRHHPELPKSFWLSD